MSSTEAKISALFVRSEEVEWQFSAAGVTKAPGVTKKVLRSDEKSGESTLLLRFEANSTYPLHTHPGGEEIFVLEGDLKVGKHDLKAGDYLYTPPDGKHAVSSRNGSLVLLREGKPVEILTGRS